MVRLSTVACFICVTSSFYPALSKRQSKFGQRCRLSAREQHAFQPPKPTGVIPNSTTSTSAVDNIPTATTSSDDVQIPTPNLNPPPPPPPPSLPNVVYGSDKIRGVNLGGWLVLEPWVTPSIFDATGNENIVDEFTFGQLQDVGRAAEVLKQHWETWITEDDFVQIAAAGLNHVRIPIGYWSVPLTSADTAMSTSTEPYIPGAWPYLLRALTWARNHGISVIVDLHGAPGSQNGFDNSGQRTTNPTWAFSPDDITRTVDTLRFIAREIGDQVSVIEFLNEPAGFRGPEWVAATRDFFSRAYQAVREVAGDNVKVMISDAYVGVETWVGFLTPPSGQNTMMDVHDYQIFVDDVLSRSIDEHIAASCANIQAFRSYEASNLWTVVGEWSNALTDCTRWINGRGTGSRYDGSFSAGPGTVSQFHGTCIGKTGSWRYWTREYIEMLTRYWEAQTHVAETVQGWIFWTWKAEDADEWSYQKGLEGGWIPQDPTSRKYPNICG
ncbi:hypothetical protein CVT24_008381 [Panaeolus cyanescens]|uniref:Glycoside hydrolase family 5 domain-containing protein n=1 Tax=Panaeolus cyanescens TaxID=181874 RepID=A0A409WCR6_9AGAR|nr:hypothetical protein CVT24_008381 [Panaeolus cyanescens]